MKTQPLKGMRDLLPREQALRDYIQGQILATYRAAGFQRISTPILEDMENLDKSDGGDNLNLIFKILKRGDKLEHALASGNEKQLSDMGLRYDLTLPLSRYYAANRNELPNPFKVIQTDRVYRAERPQKGRLREFVQCDIDILGDSSPNAEVELIDVTARALLKIGFTGFTVNINDRRILRAMLEKMGFAEDQLDSVCISFDKMDKIGADGVKAELTEKGFAPEAVQALDDFLRAGDFSLDTVAAKVDDEALTADLPPARRSQTAATALPTPPAWCAARATTPVWCLRSPARSSAVPWPAAAAMTTWSASSSASRSRPWASPSGLSASAAFCWSRAIRSPAQSRRWRCCI